MVSGEEQPICRMNQTVSVKSLGKKQNKTKQTSSIFVEICVIVRLREAGSHHNCTKGCLKWQTECLITMATCTQQGKK